MRQVQGDILQIQTGIIVHQVNCRRVMGAGLARKLREVYPEHYKDYMHAAPALGKIVFTKVGDSLYVVGAYGQDNYGRNGCHTDYHALRVALTSVYRLSQQTGLSVYLPYKIWCGLAGGDWNIVSDIIGSVLPEAVIARKV